ncbi:hypothetical protein GA0070620_1795 [Micromonospora krabiensis]|uniref:Uncharacterized protein n=1 Tax=Micromonospora krabiensis TaxID=307121 RepID=A0A1C3N148_9ACTN|nr:hypothetical protein GA0070620_1795 [Micromonospora krabiensis]
MTSINITTVELPDMAVRAYPATLITATHRDRLDRWGDLGDS